MFRKPKQSEKGYSGCNQRFGRHWPVLGAKLNYTLGNARLRSSGESAKQSIAVGCKNADPGKAAVTKRK